MRKKVTILAITLAVLVLYSAFWFWQGQRFKQSVAGILDDIATELHQVNMEFLYADLRVSGFPLSHQVYIHQPRFLGASSDFPYDIVSHVPIVVDMNLIGTRFGLELPRDLDILHYEDEKSKAYQLLFYSQPDLEVSVSYERNLKRLFDFWTSDDIHNEQFYIEGANLTSIRFNSDAISAMAVDNGIKILTVKKVWFDYQEEEKFSDQLYKHISWQVDGLQSEPFLNLAWSSQEPFGVMSSQGNIELWLPEGAQALEEGETEVVIKSSQTAISSPHFEVALHGDLTMNKENAESKEPLTLSMRSYEKAVEYAAAFYNRYLADKESERHYWTDKARIKRALKKLAIETSDDGESLVLRVEPSKEGEKGIINIGDYSMPEAAKVWETGYGTIRKRVPPQNEPVFRKEKLVPSQQIQKQIEEQPSQDDDEDEDTVYEYPNTTGRRR